MRVCPRHSRVGIEGELSVNKSPCGLGRVAKPVQHCQVPKSCAGHSRCQMRAVCVPQVGENFVALVRSLRNGKWLTRDVVRDVVASIGQMNYPNLSAVFLTCLPETPRCHAVDPPPATPLSVAPQLEA